MKTKFFSTNYLDSDEKEDYAIIENAKDQLFTVLLSWYAKQDSMPRFKESNIDIFAKETNETFETIAKLFVTMMRFLKIFSENGNEINDFLEDLNTLYPELLENRSNTKARLFQLSELSEKYNNFFRIRESALSGVSSLKSSSVSIALKPVFKTRFDIDNDDLKNYKPELIQFTPTVLFELIKEENETFSFQMTKEGFNDFVNSILSIKIELDSVLDGAKNIK